MNLSSNCPINLPRLMETRLLVQANSGGGKSWALRRLLEETAPKVQQIVIDPEGEFSTLREKFDYVICAPQGADAVAHPSTATLLARRLLETGVSAILNIYELKAHERQAFVRLFLEEMVNARKELWRPVLVVLDEAHVFCPEVGKAESTAAVIDLATRGRKRGFCLVMATQRLSKLHKDAAAEMLNKLVGRTGLDIDVKRAADELGIPAREAWERLRNLAAGEFFAYGPALSPAVIKTKIGPVATTHPKSGGRLLSAPPEPSAKIKAILAKGLQDIPKEAESEARTVADLKAELAKARAALTRAEHPAAQVGVPEKEVQRQIDIAVRAARAEKARAALDTGKAMRIRGLLTKAMQELGAEAIQHGPRPEGYHASTILIDDPMRSKGPAPAAALHGLTAPEQRILDTLAKLAAYGLNAPDKAMVAAHAGVSPTSGGYKNNLGRLRTLGAIEYPTQGAARASDTLFPKRSGA